MKVIIFIYLILLFLILLAFKSMVANPQNQLCLISNGPMEETGKITIVKVIEDRKDYYVTGNYWDQVDNKWYWLPHRLIDKDKSFYYFTEIKCPQ